MKKRKLLQWGSSLLAVVACLGPVQAQQAEPTESAKEAIIEINVNVEGLEEVNSTELDVLRQKLEEIKGLDDLELKLDKLNALEEAIEQIGKNEEEDKVLFMYKGAKTKEDKPYLGVFLEQNEQGVKINGVKENTAASEAGIKSGDIVTSIDGKGIQRIEDLQQILKAHKVGDAVKITYLREGQTQNTTATLKSWKQNYVVARHRSYNYNYNYNFYTPSSDVNPCEELAKLEGEPFIGVYIGVDYDKDGADVNSVIEATGAENSNLQAGDKITAINGEAVVDYNSLRKVLLQYQPGETVELSYARETQTGSTSVLLSSMADRKTSRRARLEALCDQQEPEVSEADVPNEEENSFETSFTPYNATLSVFPNPASDVVNIQLEDGNSDETTIRVMNMQGKLIKEQQLNGNNEQFTEQIDLSELPAGLYVISVIQGDAVLSKQISVK